MFIHVYIASTIHFTCYEQHTGRSAKCLGIKMQMLQLVSLYSEAYYVRGS